MSETTPGSPVGKPAPPDGGGPAVGTAIPTSKIMFIADDAFWLKYAKESIEAGKKACDDGAQTLLRIITWIWPIYTGTFAVGSLYFSNRMNCGSRVLLALPVLFIFLGYWCAQRSLLPIFLKYDPRIPFEIRRNYNKVMKLRRERLGYATIFCLFAVLTLSIGLIFVRIEPQSQPPITNNAPHPGKN